MKNLPLPDSEPSTQPWWMLRGLAVAIALNVLAVPTLSTGLGTVLMIPLACFFIAAFVAASVADGCPYFAWLIGAMASPWFCVIPCLVVERFREVAMMPGAIWTITGILVAAGVFGGFAGNCIGYASTYKE